MLMLKCLVNNNFPTWERKQISKKDRGSYHICIIQAYRCGIEVCYVGGGSYTGKASEK